MFHTYDEAKWELQTPEEIYQYLSGGEGIVTLLSPTGVHRVYAFNKPRCASKFPKDVLFVYVQVSSGLWIYVGMWIQHKGFYLTRASNYFADSPIVKGIEYIIKMATGKITRTPMKLFHCGVCSICGRKLTSPKSIARGMGPECRKRVAT